MRIATRTGNQSTCNGHVKQCPHLRLGERNNLRMGEPRLLDMPGNVARQLAVHHRLLERLEQDGVQVPDGPGG